MPRGGSGLPAVVEQAGLQRKSSPKSLWWLCWPGSPSLGAEPCEAAVPPLLVQGGHTHAAEQPPENAIGPLPVGCRRAGGPQPTPAACAGWGAHCSLCPLGGKGCSASGVMQRETGGALTRPKVKAPDPAELELGAPRCSRGRAAALRGPGQGSLPHAAVPPRRRAQSIGKAPGRPQQGQGGSGIALTPVPVVQGLHVTVFHGFAEPFPKGPASQDHFSCGCARERCLDRTPGGDPRETGASAALAAAPSPARRRGNAVCLSRGEAKDKRFAERSPFPPRC